MLAKNLENKGKTGTKAKEKKSYSFDEITISNEEGSPFFLVVEPSTQYVSVWGTLECKVTGEINELMFNVVFYDKELARFDKDPTYASE